MSVRKVVEFPSKAGKQLLRFERGSNYDFAEAIAEFIDNSLDWGGKNIDIRLGTHKGSAYIIVSDDGVGMTEEKLVEAASLGSSADNDLTRNTDPNDQIGVYGVGMKEAAYGLAEVITIVSKNEAAPICELVINKQKIRETDIFCGEIESGAKSSSLLFREYVKANTGTVIYMSGCYERYHNTKYNRDHLSSELSRMYRKFLDDGYNITINGQKLKSFDPLYWQAKDTTQYGPFIIPIFNRKTVHSSRLSESIPKNEKVGEIIVRLSLLGEDTLKKVSSKETSANKGIHFLRGKREICSSISDDFLAGCDKYSVRGEIISTPSLDEYLRVSGNKNKFNIHTCVKDQMARAFREWAKIIEEEIERRSAGARDEKIQNLLNKLVENINKSISKLNLPGTAGPGRKEANGPMEGKPKRGGSGGNNGNDNNDDNDNGDKANKSDGGNKKCDATGRGKKCSHINITQKSLGEQAPHMMHSSCPNGELEIIINQDNPVFKLVASESNPVQDRTLSLWIAHAFTIIKSEFSEEEVNDYSAIDLCMRQLLLADKAA